MITRGAPPSINGRRAIGPWDSAAPSLWYGSIGAYAPQLGETGNNLYDLSPNKHHGVLTGVDVGTDWINTDEGKALTFDGVAGQADISSVTPHFASDINFIQYIFVFRTTSTVNEAMLGANDNITIWMNRHGVTAANVTGTIRVHVFGTDAGKRTRGGTTTDGGWTDGEWHTIRIGYNISNDIISINIDGIGQSVSYGDQNFVLPFLGTTTHAIGGQLGANWFGSDVRFVGIWNRQVTNVELTSLINDPVVMFRRRAPVNAGIVGGLFRHPGMAGRMRQMTGGING